MTSYCEKEKRACIIEDKHCWFLDLKTQESVVEMLLQTVRVCFCCQLVRIWNQLRNTPLGEGSVKAIAAD